MATVKVKYVCGCGFSTENVAVAVLHSDKNGHTLQVNGTIQKDKKE